MEAEPRAEAAKADQQESAAHQEEPAAAEAVEPASELEPEPGEPASVAQTLAAFYDRRAPAALAYCARVCEPDQISDAVEEAFGKVFTAAAAAEAHAPSQEELETLLRQAVRESAKARARDPQDTRDPHEQAERAYDALTGDDAPALGRSLLAEVLDEKPTLPVASPQPPRKRRRRARRALIPLLAVVGTLLLAEAAITLAWKEPLTTYLAAQSQDDLSKQLDSRHPALGAADQRRLAAIHDANAREKKRIALLAKHEDDQTAAGDALGRIEIGKLGIDYVFVQGTDGASLRKGPGHYSGGTTQLPGEGGVTGIAGHRTTYEAPFRNVDQLTAGDHITLVMPYGRFTYEVTGHRIVPSDYTAAFAQDPSGAGPERLVLSACHPLYSATHRLLVDAKLTATQPLGAGIEATVPAVPQPSAAQQARARTAARLKLLGNRQLGPGTTGPDVRELQRLLGMPVSGTFDANTSAAVTAFQRDHGLPQIGLAGSQTKHALARRKHPPKTPPTPASVPQQSLPQRSQSTTGTYTQPGH